MTAPLQKNVSLPTSTNYPVCLPILKLSEEPLVHSQTIWTDSRLQFKGNHRIYVFDQIFLYLLYSTPGPQSAWNGGSAL